MSYLLLISTHTIPPTVQDNSAEVARKLEELNLPQGYNYKLLSKDNGLCSFRVKEIRDKVAAQEWMKRFEESSNSVWRTQRTYLTAGRTNIFRCDYRCQNNVPHVVKNQRKSRNTGCSAQLKLCVQRYYSLPNCSDPDIIVKEYPALLEMRYQHNHSFDCKEVLGFRKMSDQTRARLIELYKLGHGASSARRVLEVELSEEGIEKYKKKCMDTSIIPTVSTIQHFYKKEFNHRGYRKPKFRRKPAPLEPIIYTIGKDEIITDLSCNSNSINNNSSDNDILEGEDDSHQETDQNADYWGKDNMCWKVVDDDKEEHLFEELESLFNRIKRGCETDPSLFKPGIEQMLKNYKKYAQTESGLISALHNFARNPGQVTCSSPQGKTGIQFLNNKVEM